MKENREREKKTKESYLEAYDIKFMFVCFFSFVKITEDDT